MDQGKFAGDSAFRLGCQVPIEDETKERPPEKMAIGVEGGFQVDKEKFHVEKQEKICIFPNKSVDRPIQSNPDKIWIILPCDLPLKLEQAIGIIQVRHLASGLERLPDFIETRQRIEATGDGCLGRREDGKQARSVVGATIYGKDCVDGSVDVVLRGVGDEREPLAEPFDRLYRIGSAGKPALLD